jgi:phage gpG-like protein
VIAWIRRLVHGCDEPEPTDSEQALAHAQNARQQAEARQPLVESVAGVLRSAREENHFREKIEALFRGAAP